MVVREIHLSAVSLVHSIDRQIEWSSSVVFRGKSATTGVLHASWVGRKKRISPLYLSGLLATNLRQFPDTRAQLFGLQKKQQSFAFPFNATSRLRILRSDDLVDLSRVAPNVAGVGRSGGEQRNYLHHRSSHRAARLCSRQSFLPGALCPRHLQVEEFSGTDDLASEIGVSYLKAAQEGGPCTSGIFSQSGFTWPEAPDFRQLNPSAGHCSRQ